MCIPDQWPGNNDGLIRALYNIALHRLEPAAPPRKFGRKGWVINVTRDGKQYRALFRASTEAGFSVALRPDTFHNEELDSLFAIWRSEECPAEDTGIHTWLIPAERMRNFFSQEFSRPPRPDGRRNVRIVDLGDGDAGRLTSNGANCEPDMTPFYDPWELSGDQLRYIVTLEPAGPRRHERPLLMKWNDGRTAEVKSWVEVLVETTSMAIDLGLPIDRLPINSSKDGSGLSDPRRVRGDLYIQTHGDGPSLAVNVSNVLTALDRRKGFLEVVTQNEAQNERTIHFPF